ncbi:hypothetical protein [Streptomyces sp. NRRL S-241]|uniref:hypothetical protein n=1 Tax=Streptomyces sp. NRRL S-241 TaxID=1463896 RepID=UPI00131DBC95|nr:hypothetical protein [Streptomyces sp. NRRL S-241]
MAATSPTSRLITAAARSRMRPLGLRQQGRSRIWIDDHGWWLGIVEFPSPRWSQGSGLTVGAMWLWQDFDHLAFDFADRIRPAEDFRSEEQFAAVADALALEATRQVEDLRTRFSDLGKVGECLLQRPDRPGYLWESFNAGVAAALMEKPTAARQRLQSVLNEDPLSEWIREAQQAAQDVSAMAHDTAAVREWARTRVASCRTKLGLAGLLSPGLVQPTG